MVDKRLVILLLAILIFTGCEYSNKINMTQNVLDQVAYNNNGNVIEEVQQVEEPKKETTTKVVTTTKKVSTTKSTTTPVTTTTAQTTTVKKSLTMEEKMVDLINEERAKAGLKPVKLDSQLKYVADIRAAEMRDNDYFEHERPNGAKWYTVLDENKVKYKHAGENIARGFFSVEKAHTGFMNSESHKRNVLMEDFKYVGIGIAQTTGGSYYIVQIYKA